MFAKNLSRSLIAAVVAASLATGIGVTAHAAPVESEVLPTATVQKLASTQTQFDQVQLEKLLTTINQIPESVLLQGDQATQAWIAENLAATGSGANVAARGFWECSGAILLAIGTTAIPVAKILKIKKLMDGLGGVTKAIQIMWGASFSYEKLQALGGAAAALGAELLGIAAIKVACT